MIKFLLNNFSLKIVSVLIAATVWVAVVGSRTIEISKEVPFEVLVSNNQVLVDAVPEKVVFKITGPKAFMRGLSTRIEDPVRANMQGFKSGVIAYKIFSDSIKLPPGVRVLSITPNVIPIKVEEVKQKWLGVNLETTGRLSEGLKLLKSEVLPGQLRVKGPKNRLAGLNVISSQPIDLSSIRDTAIIPLTFDFKALGIEPDSILPEANVEIQRKGITYRIKGVPLKLKSNSPAEITEKEVMVIVSVDAGETMKVEGDQVSAEIDVRDYPTGEYQKWVRVKLPDRIHLLKVIPTTVRVSVKAQ